MDKSRTKTKTTEYFSDINGDGLVDLVSNGKVYFNHLEFDSNGNAVPTFTLSSADTPSPIIYSGKIDASVITIDPEEQAEAIKSSPMEDIVRVWQAPRDGMVSISGTVSLIAPEGDYDKEEYVKADGVRVSIQKGKAEKWNLKIAKGDASAHPASVDAFEIKKANASISACSPVRKKRATVLLTRWPGRLSSPMPVRLRPCRVAIPQRFTNLRKVRYMM